MSNERDELIRIIWDEAVADRVKRGESPHHFPIVRPKVEALADAILAAGYRKETADGVMVDRLQAALSAALAIAQEWEHERANFEEIHDYSNYRLSVLNNAAQKLRDAIGSALRSTQQTPGASSFNRKASK